MGPIKGYLAFLQYHWMRGPKGLISSLIWCLLVIKHDIVIFNLSIYCSRLRLMNFFFNTYVLGGFQRQQQQPSPSGSDNSIQVVSLLISQKQLSPVIIDSTYSCQIEEKGVLLCRVFKQIFNSKTLCTSVRWFKCHFLAFHKPDTPHF